MSLNPLALAFLPHYQPSSEAHISLCNSTIKRLQLDQLFCGLPPSTTTSHAFPTNQPIADGSFIVPLIQPKHPSKENAVAHHLPPGCISLLSSPLQRQVNCLLVNHKTVQQFH